MPDIVPAESMERALEADITRLTEEIKKTGEQPEMHSVSGPEILKKSIQTYAGNMQSTNAQPSAGPLPVPAQSSSPDAQLQIEQLVDMALHQGILKADAAARRASPFVLDSFHDALTGKLYPEFKKRGILK